MKKLFGFSLIIFFLIPSLNTSAQQWTAEQKEVWNSVETYNDLSAKRDAEFLSYFDETYHGWGYESDAPYTKETVKKFFDNSASNVKVLYHTITPASIWVSGNFAYVHYYYSQVTVDKDGKRQYEKGRWTDILMKKNNKWIMVGDHGGETSK